MISRTDAAEASWQSAAVLVWSRQDASAGTRARRSLFATVGSSGVTTTSAPCPGLGWERSTDEHAAARRSQRRVRSARHRRGETPRLGSDRRDERSAARAQYQTKRQAWRAAVAKSTARVRYR